MMQTMNQPMIELNNGNKMPLQGFGTLQIKDESVCENIIYEAIQSGVRMIDTAPAYFNEEALGKGIARAISDGIAKREELFLITKLWIQDTKKELVRGALQSSLNRLQTDYLDLYLIHQPYGDYLEAWPVMEELLKEGLVRNIGVCNFSEEKLEKLKTVETLPPAVNQIEIHPYFLHKELRVYMKKENIIPMAWGPLFEGQHDIFDTPKLVEIAENHDKTVAQVILRWHFQRGVPTIPKTVHPEYIREDLDILGFTLTEEEMQSIESLDLGYSEIIDHESPLTEKWLTEWKIHD